MVVSWISFVVPPDVIPGRMALLITLFLVLVNIFNTVNDIALIIISIVVVFFIIITNVIYGRMAFLLTLFIVLVDIFNTVNTINLD